VLLDEELPDRLALDAAPSCSALTRSRNGSTSDCSWTGRSAGAGWSNAAKAAGSGSVPRSNFCSVAHCRYRATVFRLRLRSRAMRRSGSPNCRRRSNSRMSVTGLLRPAMRVTSGNEFVADSDARRLGVHERNPVTSRRVAHDARPWVAHNGRPCLAQFGRPRVALLARPRWLTMGRPLTPKISQAARAWVTFA
jgi:hypothetical protein